MAGPPVLDERRARHDLPCLLCRSRRRVVLHAAAPFSIVRCRDCRLVYTLPRLPPEELRAMYQTEYWKSAAARDFGYTDYLADEALYVRTFHLRARLLERHVPPPATLLDVGCAAGFALRAFRERGYDVYGVELSEAMAEEAQRRAGAPERVRAGELAPDAFGALRFDLITLFDVIEHVEDPIALLRTARSLLTPRGRIVLETQNVASWFARLLGVRWQHYKFLEHLYHFDPRTLRRLLGTAGLELVEWTPRLGGKYVSVAFLIERIGRLHPLLSRGLRPFAAWGRHSLYVNVFDEILAVARPL